MIRISVCLFLIFKILLGNEAQAKPDSDCAGVWALEILKDENYTPWHAYTQNPPYPVKFELKTLKPGSATFTDNKGRECSMGYLNDTENKLVVFKHCLMTKHPEMIPTHYKISCKGDELQGKIVSYKNLFKLKGVRVKK